jgi:hypothetical protein
VAVTVNDEVPAVVADPEITPVEAFSDKPVGRLPMVTAQLTGALAPVTAKVWLYPTPTSPLGSDVVLTATVMV